MPGESYEHSPIIVGGTGGSGTRVIAQICAETGYYMGHDLNVAYDTKSFNKFLKFWVDPFLESRADLPAAEAKQMRKDFKRSVQHHRYALNPPEGAWGWKNPRNVFLFPFLHAQFPNAKFIQIVRDGRDMAFSENQNQLKIHGYSALGNGLTSMSVPAQSIAFWNAINNRAAAYAESHMDGRYLWVRLESVCRDTDATLDRILNFIGREDADRAKLKELIVTPSTLGRWQKESPEIVAQLNDIAREGLERFGYLSRPRETQTAKRGFLYSVSKWFGGVDAR